MMDDQGIVNKLSGSGIGSTDSEDARTIAEGAIRQAMLKGVYVDSDDFLQLRRLALTTGASVKCDRIRIEWGPNQDPQIVSRTPARFP